MNEENKNLNTNAPEATAPEATAPEVNAPEVNAPEAEPKKKADKKAPKAKKAKKEGKGGFKTFLKSRKARHGSIAVAIVAVVIAIVVVLNIICTLLTDRFPDLKFDITSNNSYALQDDTLDYVSHLDKDVTVTILMTKDDFISGGTYLVQAQTLLEKMQSNSDGKLSIDYVDLTSNPTFTSKYTDVDWTDSSSNYMMVVECGDQYKVLTLEDCFEYDEEYYYYYGSLQITGTTVEQAVVTAILNVTTEDKVVVDMITGNQEQDYSAITSLLSNNAYDVNEISLATQDIDENAKIVMLYAPSVDLDESAIEKLSNWLENDGDYGRTLIYVPTADMPEAPNLSDFLAEWGMEIDTGYVFETSNDYLVSSSTPYAFLVDYTDYYKDGLKNSNIPVVVSDTHAINITDEETAHPILTTSTSAGIFPLDADENWNYNDSITGNALNVAAEGVKTNTDEASSNVIVFGAYSMFSSSIMSYNSYNNSAYLMNVINTVADKDDTSITIESKSIDSGELGVTDVATSNVVMVIFVIVLPIAVIALGLVLWIRRRNK
jgi:hypothetical protein